MNRILITVGPFKIYWYSITMLLAVLTGISLSIKESKKVGMESYISDLITSLIIFGILGARLYYVVFNFDAYKNDLLSILKIWEGGIAIYGAILGGLTVIIYRSIKDKQNILKTTDIFMPGLILAQSIRWGNFFNGEAHGKIVTLTYLEKLHLPKFIIDGMYINGAYYEPTFLYESMWCLLGFFLLIIIRKITNRKTGLMTYIYCIWYGLGRIFIEGLRTDSLYLGDIRISQLVSLIIIIFGIFGIIITYIKTYKLKKRKRELIWKNIMKLSLLDQALLVWLLLYI